MQRFYSKILLNMGMQYGDIAIPDDPLGIPGKICKIKSVNDPDCTVTPTCTYDPFDGSIIQHLLQIGLALFIRPCKLIGFIKYARAENHFPSPFLK